MAADMPRLEPVHVVLLSLGFFDILIHVIIVQRYDMRTFWFVVTVCPGYFVNRSSLSYTAFLFDALESSLRTCVRFTGYCRIITESLFSTTCFFMIDLSTVTLVTLPRCFINLYLNKKDWPGTICSYTILPIPL